MDTHQNLVENLASSYKDLKQHIKLRNNEYKGYYGLRDFYSMIKLVSRMIAHQGNVDKKNLIKIIKISIERNFGGKLDAAKFVGG
jgi:hypothetical protein